MDHYAVVGHPIEHSLSPTIHRLFAEQTGQDLSYEKILAPLDAFEETIRGLIERGYKGVNVTLPFKERAFALASKRSSDALEAHAANTLVFRDDGVIEGHNTDGVGLVQDLTHNHHYSLRQKRILIIGCGGAVKGIVGPLMKQAPAQLIIANRTKEKSVELAEHFALFGHVHGCGLDDIGHEPYDLIIHGTSVRNTEDLVFPGHLVGEQSWCYDLNYDRVNKTPFVQWAELQGAAKALDGIGMLIEQAAISFRIWRGVYPDTKGILSDL